MPSKLQTYMQMADEAQRQITGSYRGWTGFLTTAARLYKYPYAEQVMIHAQRPDATACAEYDFWNEKMGRYVRRGSKGIALIDSSGERPRLRYVFDVSDTGGREFPKSRYLWEYRAEHADAVSAMLESRYGVDGKGGLPDQLERIASQLAEEYWRDYKRDILAIVDDSFLYGYWKSRTTKIRSLKSCRSQNNTFSNWKEKQTMNSIKTLYKLMEVSSRDLEIPDAYQRKLNTERVAKIVAGFNERIANEPKVSFRDGHYYVFDGQHTIVARKHMNGNNDLPILCKVYYGMTEADEACLLYTSDAADEL